MREGVIRNLGKRFKGRGGKDVEEVAIGIVAKCGASSKCGRGLEEESTKGS